MMNCNCAHELVCKHRNMIGDIIVPLIVHALRGNCLGDHAGEEGERDALNNVFTNIINSCQYRKPSNLPQNIKAHDTSKAKRALEQCLKLAKSEGICDGKSWDQMGRELEGMDKMIEEGLKAL